MAAVRSVAKFDVQHAIYREIDADYKIEDIKLRIQERLSDNDNHKKALLRFVNDKDFISDVYYRWEKSLSWR